MRDAFYMLKNTKCMRIQILVWMLIYNVYVVENGGRYPIGNDFTMHFN